jgi:hypothetical protein
VPVLREHLRPVPPIDPRRLAPLVADLGSDEFETRQRAARELERMGEAAEPYLRRKLAEKPTPEVGRAIDLLLGRVEARAQRTRALEVLEYVGTAEAKGLLDDLAKGAPEAWLTREAKAARQRLGRR